MLFWCWRKHISILKANIKQSMKSSQTLSVQMTWNTYTKADSQITYVIETCAHRQMCYYSCPRDARQTWSSGSVSSQPLKSRRQGGWTYYFFMLNFPERHAAATVNFHSLFLHFRMNKTKNQSVDQYVVVYPNTIMPVISKAFRSTPPPDSQCWRSPQSGPSAALDLFLWSLSEKTGTETSFQTQPAFSQF